MVLVPPPQLKQIKFCHTFFHQRYGTIKEIKEALKLLQVVLSSMGILFSEEERCTSFVHNCSVVELRLDLGSLDSYSISLSTIFLSVVIILISFPFLSSTSSMQLDFFFFLPHHTTCRISVPQPGIEPRRSAVRVQSPNHWTTREFQCSQILMCVKH